jgi:hypothetical protein
MVSQMRLLCHFADATQIGDGKKLVAARVLLNQSSGRASVACA